MNEGRNYIEIRLTTGDKNEVQFANQFYTLPDEGFYYEGSMSVTKKVLDADGNPMDSDEVFYAGIFTDIDHTELAPLDKVERNVIALTMNGASSVTEEIPVYLYGETPEEASETFCLTETDSEGNPVENGFEINGISYSFTLENDGEVTVTLSDMVNSVITNQIEEHQEEEDNPSLTVTKSLAALFGEDVFTIGAEKQSYYVALFTDEDLTEMVDGSRQELVYEHASSASVIYEGLDPETTYYVAEVDENGTPVTASEAFTPIYDEEDETVTCIEADMSEGNLETEFTNLFSTLPDGFYYEGNLEVTKQVVDENGSAVTGDYIFYAGIFMDENHEELAPLDLVSRNIIPLNMNGESSVEEDVQVFLIGDPNTVSRTFYIAETNAEGEVLEEGFEIGEDYFGIQIEGDGRLVVTTGDAATATITNVLGGGGGEETGDKASLSVTKNLEAMFGADEVFVFAGKATYYVALFTDEDLTDMVEDSIREISYADSHAGTATYDDLDPDTTCYVAEVDQSGKPFRGDDYCAPVYDAEDGDSIEVDLSAGTGDVEFANLFVKLPDGYYFDSKIEVTKKVMTSSGVEARSNGTFYAGVFKDEKFTRLAENVTPNILTLAMGGTTSAVAGNEKGDIV